MSFLDWQRERFIRKTLRKLSRQRVVGIAQPGNVWVIEKSPPKGKKLDAALRTCHIRGWIEILVNAVPKGQLTKEGELPDGKIFDEVGPIYRLTDSGWNAINRTHDWGIVTCMIAWATLIAALTGLIARIAGWF